MQGRCLVVERVNWNVSGFPGYIEMVSTHTDHLTEAGGVGCSPAKDLLQIVDKESGLLERKVPV